MDGAALSALAAALGAGLVEAMTTDAWHAARDRISRIFGRGSAAREGETSSATAFITAASGSSTTSIRTSTRWRQPWWRISSPQVKP